MPGKSFEAAAIPATEAGTTIMQFGQCQLFTNRRELLVDGVPVPLGSRAFDILQVLVEAGGDLVTKDEILSRVWPGTVVEENTLQVQIMQVRRALGKDRGFLKTISGRGYRFVAEATSAAATTPEALAPEREKRTNLPAQTSPLLDRQPELSEVLRLVAAHRLVTLTGVGGIGKTRLALEVARHLPSQLPDGAWLVELGPLTDPDLVSVTVATALRLPLPAGASPDEVVAHALGTKHLLIVLDNCEHVIEAAASAAERLVRGTAAVRVLATSREPLRADGEQVYRVPGLDVPVKGTEDPDEVLRHGAVRLFVIRARAAEPQFSADGRVTAAIAEVCRRLDGIPLAIEFAAARAATLGVENLAVRLDDLFRLLIGGRRAALPRHQTLRATLDWSYELLPEAERAVLRRLAVLPGPFMLEAACAIAADADITACDIINSISSLVSKSMIAATLAGALVRYRLLETTRAYALEKLIGSDEFDSTARRHAEYSRAVFERAMAEWETHSTDQWLAAYAGRLDNVRAALDWAWSARGDAALGVALTAAAVPLWIQLWLLDECRTRVDQALANLDRASSRGTRYAMQLWAARAWSLFNSKGPAPETVAAWTNALQMAEHLEHVDYQLRALWGQWACHFARGEHSNALVLANRFSKLAQGQSDPTDALVGERMRGGSLHYLGDQTGAREHLERMLERYVPPTRRSHIVRFQFNQQIVARLTLARTLWLQGLPDQALHLVRGTVEDTRVVEHAISLSYALTFGACPVALWVGDLATAQHFVTLLLEVSTRPGLQGWNDYRRYFEGALACRRGDSDSGLPLLRSALDTLDARANALHYPAFLGEFAAALGVDGQVDQGLAAIEEALARCRHDCGLWCEPELLRIQGELRLLTRQRGAARTAQQLFSAGLDCAHRQGALSWELRCATSLSRLWRKENRVQDAHSLLAPILARFEEGFASADVIIAKALLDELQQTNPTEHLFRSANRKAESSYRASATLRKMTSRPPKTPR
jgi:predicted ATPase/DNA-binding winged helix-turn-helix (wHTH) protein